MAGQALAGLIERKSRALARRVPCSVSDELRIRGLRAADRQDEHRAYVPRWIGGIKNVDRCVFSRLNQYPGDLKGLEESLLANSWY